MKIIISFLIFLCPIYVNAQIDTNATTETKALYTELQKAQGNYIYFGQQSYTKTDFSQSFTICGQYPSILATDIEYDKAWFGPGNSMMTAIKTHYRNSGVVMVSWHMYNWVTFNTNTYVPGGTGSAWDDSGDPVVNILPGGTARATYLSKLDTFSNWCKALKDDRGNLIPIIFRPFHEADGTWFWWGIDTCTEVQFISLWQDLITYLRDTKGVHNLIYCYSPNLVNEYSYDGTLYPGDDYVDVFGIDKYSDSNDISSIITAYQETYDASVTHEKVFGITEGMRNLITHPTTDYWTWYANQILGDNKVKNTAFLNVWTSDKWGANSTRSDAPSFLEMSQNPKIKFLQYKTYLGKGTYGKGTWN